MTIYDLKPKFQNLLRPICKGMAQAGVTANAVTLSALALSFAWGALFAVFAPARWVLFGLPVILFLRMALNAIDGMLAREHNMKSRLGAILNEMGDVASDTFLYLPFVCLPGAYPPAVFAAVLLAVASEMAGVVAVQIGAQRRYDGPMGKSDRAFVFGTLSFLIGCGLPVSPWVTCAMGAVAALLVVTTWRRSQGALRETQP
jgi:CDP-diacylglycerol--glycerol-3-phosphate 3-phosphatidyltransferase